MKIPGVSLEVAARTFAIEEGLCCIYFGLSGVSQSAAEKAGGSNPG
jgi:hypothetical protein